MLIAAWPMKGLPVLAFVAWVPLMHLLETGHESGWRRPFFRGMGWSFVALLVWNAGTTWWLFYATVTGAIAAIALNSLFMSVVLGMVHAVRASFNLRKGMMAWVALWIGWEYFHFRWDLSWPWLTLGHVFSEYPGWVQWYEYTGVLGGSLWVLMGNIALFYLLRTWRSGTAGQRAGRITAALLVLGVAPMIGSHLLLQADAELEAQLPPENQATIGVVQPNVDPYTEKFNINDANSAQNILFLIRELIDAKPDFILIPETAIPNGFDERDWDSQVALKILASSHRKRHPEIELLYGATTYLRYPAGKSPTLSARPLGENAGWYDLFNTAIHQRRDSAIAFYHKSKLVVGVEMTPFRSVIKPLLGDVLIDLGGTSSSFGIQKNRSVFTHQNQRTVIAPVICYESIYGAYCKEYIERGARMFGIITNDGWWSDSPGHQQHFSLARLLAVSHRRPIARSANTGISGFISARGDVESTLAYETRGAIAENVTLRDRITFYTIYGDAIGRIALWIGLFFVLYTVVERFKSRRPNGTKMDA